MNPTFRAVQTSFSHMPCSYPLAGWGRALLALRSILRLGIQLLALAGVVVGTCQVTFALTATCRTTKDQSQFVWAQVTLERFSKALKRFRADCGGYPTPQMGLRALIANPGMSTWNGPYTRGPLIDPWGRQYLYDVADGVPVVRSFGADGKPGGDLYDADLSSQNPTPPPHESRSHAARRFFEEKIESWVVLAASLWIWFRAART